VWAAHGKVMVMANCVGSTWQGNGNGKL